MTALFWALVKPRESGYCLSMARIFLLTVLCAVLPVFGAFAQDALRVRAGEHEGYSRLVFDFDQSMEYESDTATPGKLVLSFKGDAAVNTAGIAVDSISNIQGFDVLSQKPLKISVGIPEGSRTRSFRAGPRLVVDIYDPPGGKPKSEFEVSGASAVPEPTPEPVPEPNVAVAMPPPVVEEKKPEPEVKHEPEPASVLEPVHEPEAAPAAISAEVAVAEEHTEEHEKEEPPQQVAEALPPPPTNLEAASEGAAVPHVITITSTKSVGVTVFDNNGELWLVTDKNEFYLKPQVNGPTPEIFPPFKEQKIDGGLAYATKVPSGMKARGQGGGLLWRIVVSGESNQSTPSEPVRKIPNPKAVRGGTLVWPFEEPGQVMKFTDAVSGDTLFLVTTASSKDFGGPAREFVDFDMLASHAGLAIRPKVDDLEVKVTEYGVEVTRPGGLAIASETLLAMSHEKEKPPEEGGEDEKGQKKEKKKSTAPRIYSFSEWRMGGLDVLDQNKTVMLGKMNGMPEGEKLETLLILARMHLANGRAAEALGFISFAQEEMPELESNPDFLALRGAANVMNGDSEEAFNELSIDALKPYEEVNFWRAAALADLGDWQQAYEIMPVALDPLYDYPEAARTRLVLALAEIALRGGNIDLGDDLLDIVNGDKKILAPPFLAALQYLQGESFRQAGQTDETKKIWKKLVEGPDDLYRAKAGLALTRLQVQEGDIKLDKAIDNLERLRYAWRGDQLEASISYWLGRTYFDAKDYIKGLTIMRDATAYSAGTQLGKRITEEMTQAFTDLFIGPHLNDVSPLDAVALYEQFGELTPAGADGDKVVEMLAERLVQADLLDRAGDLLQNQIEHRLSGDDAARVSVRLAAIRLLAAQPVKAIVALDKAEGILKSLPPETATPARYNEISLLRARAYSQDKKPDLALAVLKGMERTQDVNRLRADVAWKAAYWDDAAEALGDVILDRDISLTRPLNEEDATFILHHAIALNLASDRIALANMREKYADAMLQTEKSRMFEVVTRPRQNAALADRDTLLSIVSEVDMFKGFLDSYKGSQTPSN